jgi:hypothetical protein
MRRPGFCFLPAGERLTTTDEVQQAMEATTHTNGAGFDADPRPAPLADAASRLLWGHSPASGIGLGAELLAQSVRVWKDADWDTDQRWADARVQELRAFFDRPDADRTRVLLALSSYLDELAANLDHRQADLGEDPEP